MAPMQVGMPGGFGANPMAAMGARNSFGQAQGALANAGGMHHPQLGVYQT